MKVSIIFSQAVLVFGIFASVVDGRVGVQDIENDDVNASTQKSFHTRATQIKELRGGHMTSSTVPTKDPLPPGHPPGPAPFHDNLIAHASNNAGILHKTDEKRLIKIFDNDVMDSALASDAGMAFPNAHISHEEGEKLLLQANVGMCVDTYNCNCNWDWCHRRALMGTCTSPDNFNGHNSDFMDVNCCNSCHIMANNPDSLCVNLHSNNGDCNRWANDGECLRNPLWMHNECCESCAGYCKDANQQAMYCLTLAKRGYCTSDTTNWMIQNCCHTCMLMVAAPSLLGDLNGYTCNQDDDCVSGRCHELKCRAKLFNGFGCARDNDCTSGSCVVLESGMCMEKVRNGQECLHDNECISGKCRLGAWEGSRICRQ